MLSPTSGTKKQSLKSPTAALENSGALAAKMASTAGKSPVVLIISNQKNCLAQLIIDDKMKSRAFQVFMFENTAELKDTIDKTKLNDTVKEVFKKSCGKIDMAVIVVDEIVKDERACIDALKICKEIVGDACDVKIGKGGVKSVDDALKQVDECVRDFRNVAKGGA